jgi:hypothetical protein
VRACVCMWLIFNFLSTLMGIRTDDTLYESAAHRVESYFACRMTITVPIPRIQYIKIFACGNSVASE